MPKFSEVICPVCNKNIAWEDALIWVPTRDENNNLLREPNSKSIMGKYKPQGLIESETGSADGESIAFELAVGRPLQCPRRNNFLGEEIEPHDLPDGIYDRPSTIVGLLGPADSGKSTLLGLMANHACGTKPRPLRNAGLSFQIESRARLFDKNYGPLTRNQSLEPTPPGVQAPWVTLEVISDGNGENNMILCDSAGENFNGRINSDGYGQAAAVDMPFLFSADVLMICVPPSHLELAPPAINDNDNDDHYEDLANGLKELLIKSQRALRRSAVGRIRALPWVCIVITKADSIGVDGVEPLPELSLDYRTTKRNVSYLDLKSEAHRIMDESDRIRSWIREHDIHVFDLVEDNSMDNPHRVDGKPVPQLPLFRGFSYHLITARSGGSNENNMFEAGAYHERILDTVVMTAALIDADSKWSDSWVEGAQ